jgi:osmoprotectant transport system substrate-binding protein
MRSRLLIVTASLVTFLAVAGAWMGPKNGESGTGGVKPTVRIGSTNFGEQVILAEAYAQILEANGYPVERKLNLGSREIVQPALASNQIDLYPEYLATMLAFVSRGEQQGSTDAEETHRQLQEILKPRGIAVLDYAPGANTSGFVVTKATADKLGLTRVSDLAPVGKQIVLGGAPECLQRPFCLVGLRERYGITFKEFRPLDVSGPLTTAALEGGQIDVAVTYTTDAKIAARGWVLLEDDKGLQLADNVAPVVREDLLTRAPTDLRTLIDSLAPRLTTATLTELNRQADVDRRDPKRVAADWLRANGLVK